MSYITYIPSTMGEVQPLPSPPLPSPPYQDLHELETQVKRLVDTIDQQSTHIGALKEELEQQREVSTDMT